MGILTIFRSLEKDDVAPLSLKGLSSNACEEVTLRVLRSSGFPSPLFTIQTIQTILQQSHASRNSRYGVGSAVLASCRFDDSKQRY